MNKLIYWVGVYTICITIYDLPRIMHNAAGNYRKIKKRVDSEIDDIKKGACSIEAEKAHKPLDRIGF